MILGFVVFFHCFAHLNQPLICALTPPYVGGWFAICGRLASKSWRLQETNSIVPLANRKCIEVSTNAESRTENCNIFWLCEGEVYGESDGVFHCINWMQFDKIICNLTKRNFFGTSYIKRFDKLLTLKHQGFHTKQKYTKIINLCFR